jgi:hypothetical protein
MHESLDMRAKNKESTRFDIEGMQWKDKAQIFIPELQMNWGEAWSALKKSWKSYKKARASNNQMEMNILAVRINNIQEWMGIEVTDFD